MKSTLKTDIDLPGIASVRWEKSTTPTVEPWTVIATDAVAPGATEATREVNALSGEFFRVVLIDDQAQASNPRPCWIAETPITWWDLKYFLGWPASDSSKDTQFYQHVLIEEPAIRSRIEPAYLTSTNALIRSEIRLGILTVLAGKWRKVPGNRSGNTIQIGNMRTASYGDADQTPEQMEAAGWELLDAYLKTAQGGQPVLVMGSDDDRPTAVFTEDAFRLP